MSQSLDYYANARAITPSDTDDVMARGLYVNVSGDLVIEPYNGGATVTFTGVPAQTPLPIGAKRVLATGTTATGIIALY